MTGPENVQTMVHIGELLSISMIQELLTVAAPIHGLPASLCCSREALIDENWFCQIQSHFKVLP